MRKLKVFSIAAPIVLLMILFIMPVRAAEKDRYYLKYEVVAADSKAEALRLLEENGYTLIDENIAEHDNTIDDNAVYVGYKKTDAFEAERDEYYVGGVFGNSYFVMAGGVGMAAGVIIGMLSMKFKRISKEKADEN